MKKNILIEDESGADYIKVRPFLTLLLLCFVLFAGATGAVCTAKTAKGEPCKAHPKQGETLCYFHNPAYQCEGKKGDGTRCKGRKSHESKFCHWHQPQTK